MSTNTQNGQSSQHNNEQPFGGRVRRARAVAGREPMQDVALTLFLPTRSIYH